MQQTDWKLDRIRSLRDEVRELHPALKQLFRKIPGIDSVEYCQGPSEKGADFVLTRYDKALMMTDYVGVVVKSSTIRQDHEDTRRQIRECTYPRPIEGGKKTVRLSEVWIVTSQNITANAKEIFSNEYQATNIRFLDSEKLVQLFDLHAPEYWDFVDSTVSLYLNEQKERIHSHASLHRLLPPGIDHVKLDRQIESAPNDSKRRFQRSKSRPVKLVDEIKKKKLVHIEGQMGSGKSDLMRTAALEMCEDHDIRLSKMAPSFLLYRDLGDDPDCLLIEAARIRNSLGDETLGVVFFVDGLDETSHDLDERVERACALARRIQDDPGIRLVVSSREIRDEKLLDQMSKTFDRYTICPLSHSAIVSFIVQICRGLEISNRLRADLQTSPLLKALPKTPLSAILLGKLVSEKVRELPSTLPELYSKYCELVLGRWDLQKNGAGSEKEYETTYRITSHVAAYMYDNDLEAIGLAELREMFSEYLSRRRTGQDLNALLQAFLGREEIVAYDPKEQLVGFRHRTFQEFFSAVLLYQTKGKEAPLSNPFSSGDAREYFYLGLIKDAPERICQLRQIDTGHELDTLVKSTSLGALMMAAYQTPYEEITKTTYECYAGMAELYDAITLRGKDSWLCKLPELQLLALLTTLMKHSFSYEFFADALKDAKLHFESEVMSLEKRAVGIFMIDATLADLKDADAFVDLVERHEASMPWAVRMGISFASKDAQIVNSATRSMEKRMKRYTKHNPPLISYLNQLQSVPMDERKPAKNLRPPLGS